MIIKEEGSYENGKKEGFEFIPEELYKNLDKEVRKNLLDYREKYRLFVLKQKRVDTLNKKLKKQKELLKEIKTELTDIVPHIDHLKKDYMFNCSVVGFKKGNKRYNNLCISRTGHGPKNCSLGNEDTIKKHLLEYYGELWSMEQKMIHSERVITSRQGDSRHMDKTWINELQRLRVKSNEKHTKFIKEIKSDWKGFLKIECNYGDTYTRIMEMIMTNSLGLKNETINRHTFFPLDETIMKSELTKKYVEFKGRGLGDWIGKIG